MFPVSVVYVLLYLPVLSCHVMSCHVMSCHGHILYTRCSQPRMTLPHPGPCHPIYLSHPFGLLKSSDSTKQRHDAKVTCLKQKRVVDSGFPVPLIGMRYHMLLLKPCVHVGMLQHTLNGCNQPR